MKRLIASILLILVFFIAPVHSQEIPHRDLQVVFIQPADEEFTQEEQNKALNDLRAAFAYWDRHAPLSYTVQISSTLFMTTTEDILNETNRPVHVDDLAIFIVDNSNSREYLLQNRFIGLASDTTIWTLTLANAETYAHEIGHMLYGLGHHYDSAVDIMNLVPEVAWQLDTLGCATRKDLVALASQCQQYYFPMIYNQ